MRKRLVIIVALTAAACSKAPEAGDTAGPMGNASAGLAFAYGYAFELSSRSVADLQETHAQACEQAGVARCRITGLAYTVDRDGEASASLSVKVAAGLARRFGRNAVVAAEGLGATLVGAEITGEEVQPAIAAASTTRGDAQADISAIDRALADPRLSPAERAQLRAQRAERVATDRESAASAGSQVERLANTPMTFRYHTGHGVGFGNALRDSADTALSSTRATLIAATWLVAALGPPAILLLFLWLAWRRWGRRFWLKATGDPTD